MSRNSEYILYYDSGVLCERKTPTIKTPRKRVYTRRVYFIAMKDNVPLKKKFPSGRNSILMNYILEVGLSFLKEKV